MPFTTNRGQRIAFDVVGSGPTVLLQNGLTIHRATWTEFGYVDAFVDTYQVVPVDSLGQGDSDKPDDVSLYGREQRAGDLVAVLDELGVERAHVVGYSMGAWMAGGVLLYHPHRLASLVVGGFDLLGGMAATRAVIRSKYGKEATFEAFMRLARRAWPEQCAWITPDIEPALRCCYASVDEMGGEEAALRAFDRPVLAWCGADDEPYEASKELAERYEHVMFLETAGNQAAAVFGDGLATSRIGLRSFVDRAEAQRVDRGDGFP